MADDFALFQKFQAFLAAQKAAEAQRDASDAGSVESRPRFAAPPSIDFEQTLSDAMKLRVKYDSNTVVYHLIQNLYKAAPSDFVITGGLHNTPTGDETYFSVQYKMFENAKTGSVTYLPLHIYVTVRGRRPAIQKITAQYFGNTYVFECYQAPPAAAQRAWYE